MTNRPDKVDLETLCEQIFSGVYPVHGEKIINERRALLYSEATRALYTAGYDDGRIASEMSRLEQILQTHLQRVDASENGSTTTANQGSTDRPADDAYDNEPLTRKQFRPESSRQPDTTRKNTPKQPRSKTALPVLGWSVVALIFVLSVLLWYDDYTKQRPLPETTFVVEHIFTKSTHPGFFPSRDGYEKVQAWCDTPDNHPMFFGLFQQDTPAASRKGRIILKTANKENGYIWSCARNEELPFEDEYRKAIAAHWSTVKDKILRRAGELGHHFPCDLAITAVPHYGDDELYERDIRTIESWLAKEQDRLQECIKDTRLNLLASIRPFLNDLFERETPQFPAVMLSDVVAAYAADRDIDTLYQNLQGAVMQAAAEKYAENTQQWNQYVEDVINPARKNGQQYEQQWARERQKAQSDKEFREQFGVGPDDYCQYEDRRGRQYRKVCSEAVKDPNWHDPGDGGFSRMMRSLGEMAVEADRQRRQDTTNSYSVMGNIGTLVLTQNYAMPGYWLYSDGTYSATPGAGTSGGSYDAAGCNAAPSIGTFEPCFFPEPDCSLKTKGIFGSCRDFAKEKACQAEAEQRNTARQRAHVSDLKQKPECSQRAFCLEAALDGKTPDECKSGSAGKTK